MELIYTGLKLPVEQEEIGLALAKKMRIPERAVSGLVILRRSLDARKKPRFFFVYTIKVNLDLPHKEIQKLLARIPELKAIKEQVPTLPEKPERVLTHPPIVVGSGPAGYFAALALARQGYCPLVFERGSDVDRRTDRVQAFWRTGELDPDSNVQFGEGGAGTFSDGKLTTRIQDSRMTEVLATFVKHGASPEICYMAKAHIGTDVLRHVVKGMRKELESLGGKIFFNSPVETLWIEDGKLKGVVVKGEKIPAQSVILATGHSARDVYAFLKEKGIGLTKKNFAVGLRIEHPQSLINIAQYGVEEHPLLGAADYQLTYQDEPTGRGSYAFCMCPGGQVVGAASEFGGVVTNGMSEYGRDSGRANSALVVTVGERDFPNADPLAGVYFQQEWERQAFRLGGENYHAPAQSVEDFLARRNGGDLALESSYGPGVVPCELHQVLPAEIGSVLERAILDFDRKIKGFAGRQASLTGIETRTSAPVRIVRNETGMSPDLEGLYPAGEGSGYAGGIMSAAVDGLRSAEKLMAVYARKGS